ncbi:SDR family NAD(P)-dependent oxidoreductase [Streptomyces clavuligerus]|uniref:Dehydrogenase n=1 Tax=Streptomyces clavuligerus TaxID=1901 RepID=B5GNQ3_STRCL|nr:SDR family oxidoreductase [Streptomyces clavuligerus]ANW18770.1 short-chain dehydrogenase [Streptomyces clavuligerus]AXU13336.1 SDR family oxidoreductase [Streptomyces clavuligerus]EDY47875.1 dehydrogenase [Streptomyces clavuligerus]EFG08552.1 Dehydrogenase [Streptomyces clavuligerus]MBY6303291.1 SDR family oxidoreductase [Streptomyces clavuligerus]
MSSSARGKLAGRVVLITGAARGQGEQQARLFAAEGASVVLGDILDEAGGAVAGELGESAVYTRLDVGREEDWSAAVALAKERFGRVDGLINNAGVTSRGTLLDTSPAEYESIIRVNQTGTFLGMRAVAPEIAAAGGGTIVNIASILSLTGMAENGPYVASKHAILGLTRVAALELASQGIRVNAVCPGWVDTPMADPVNWDPDTASYPESARAAMGEVVRRTVPLGRVSQPVEMARIALFLSCEDSSYITGQSIVADGGLLAGAPQP